MFVQHSMQVAGKAKPHDPAFKDVSHVEDSATGLYLGTSVDCSRVHSQCLRCTYTTVKGYDRPNYRNPKPLLKDDFSSMLQGRCVDNPRKVAATKGTLGTT